MTKKILLFTLFILVCSCVDRGVASNDIGVLSSVLIAIKFIDNAEE